MKIKDIKNKIKSILKSRLFIILLLVLIYLILANDGYHQWDEACYLSEAAYHGEIGYQCFESDHYSFHIFLLTFLVDIFGKGLFGLFAVDFVYALLMLGFFYICYLIFKEILAKENDAFITSLILMFLPLSLYFGHKTMTEVPAMLLGAVSLLFFIKGYKSENKKRIFYYILSGLSLYVSSISRFDGPVLFFSFVGALCLISIKNKFKVFEAKKVLISALYISLIFFIIFSSVFFVFRFNGYERFISSKTIYETLNMEYDESKLPQTYEHYHSKERAVERTAIETFQVIIYNFFRRVLLGGSLFYLLAILSLCYWKEKGFRFAFLWYFLSLIPIASTTEFAETRYLYMSSAPLAILVFLGLKKILSWIKKDKSKKIALVAIMSLFVITNLSFIYYIEIAISGRDYNNLIRQLDTQYDDYTILTPNNWADYSFLRFAYPEKKIISVQTLEDGTRTYNGKEEVKNIEQLRKIDNVQIFICHQRIREVRLLEKIFTNTPFNIRPGARGICKNSWLWIDENIQLTEIYKSGSYTAYIAEEK